jgi:hypothetical protein
MGVHPFAKSYAMGLAYSLQSVEPPPTRRGSRRAIRFARLELRVQRCRAYGPARLPPTSGSRSSTSVCSLAASLAAIVRELDLERIAPFRTDALSATSRRAAPRALRRVRRWAAHRGVDEGGGRHPQPSYGSQISARTFGYGRAASITLPREARPPQPSAILTSPWPTKSASIRGSPSSSWK